MIKLLICFLLEPSNTYKLWDFNLSLHDSNLLLLVGVQVHQNATIILRPTVPDSKSQQIS